MKKKYSGGRIFGYSLLGAVVLCLLVISIGFSMVTKSAHQRFQDQVKLNGQAGIPTNLAEANKYSYLPDSENSLEIYLPILKTFTTRQSILKQVTQEHEARNKKLLHERKYHAIPNEHSQIQAETDLRYVKANQEGLQKLPEALKRPYFKARVPLGDPTAVMPDIWEKLNEFSTMLQTTCFADAKKNPQKAVKELNQLTAMANQLYQKSVLANDLLRGAIDLRAIGCGEEILKRNANNIDISNKVLAATSKIEPPEPVLSIPLHVFQSVYFAEHATKEQFGKWLSSTDSPPPLWVRLPWARDEFAAGLAQFGREGLATYQKYGNDYPELIKKLNDLNKSSYSGTKYDSVLSGSDFFQANIKFQIMRDQRVLELACRLNSDRLASKRVPSNLKKYGILAVNPMTNQPMVYKTTIDSIKIIGGDSPSNSVQMTGQNKNQLNHFTLNFAPISH